MAARARRRVRARKRRRTQRGGATRARSSVTAPKPTRRRISPNEATSLDLGAWCRERFRATKAKRAGRRAQ
eukprot:5717804-Prymnesium_polylepis.1